MVSSPLKREVMSLAICFLQFCSGRYMSEDSDIYQLLTLEARGATITYEGFTVHREDLGKSLIYILLTSFLFLLTSML